ncbi:MAG TPA: TIGR03435 family protein [Bryobacteraceae bacterium]|nr:TIGR03435 family protein [Bryobacteraceae bacterium]
MHGGPGTKDPGRITYGQCDLVFLVSQAYGVQRDQITGSAVGLKGNGYGYDIEATMPVETTKEQFRLMLQHLLLERFRITLHHEGKSFPGYELVVSKGGPKLKTALPEDARSPEEVSQIARDTLIDKDARGFPVLPPGLPWRFDKPHLGTVGMIRGRFHVSRAQFLTYLPYMIIESLQASPGSMPTPRVVDRTALAGVYDFTLEYVGGTPGASAAASTNVMDDPRGGSGPTLFTALKSQVGLELIKVKDVRVDMLVVDHADRIPTDN